MFSYEIAIVSNETSTNTGVKPVFIIEETSETHPIGGTIISPFWPFNSLTMEVVI